MNSKLKKLIFATSVFSILLSFNNPIHAQVTIGSDAGPTSGTLLDLKENENVGVNSTKGLKFPRLTLASKTTLEPIIAITDAAWIAGTAQIAHIGLTVYNVSPSLSSGLNEGLHTWNGASWVGLTSSAWGLSGNTVASGDFLGTKNSEPLVFKTNDLERMTIAPTGEVSTNTLTVNTAFRYTLNPGAGFFLKSDASGNASWQAANTSPTAPPAQLSVDGITFKPSTITENINPNLYLPTGAMITLPPGKWFVIVTMLVDIPTFPLYASNSSSSCWLRSTFLYNGSFNPTDFDGPFLISGLISPHVNYQIMTGYVIINNTTTSDKVFEFAIGRTEPSSDWPADVEISGFSKKSAGENSIVAFGLYY